MQGTIAMLMVLGGLGCHHRGCNDCYATPYAGGCYSACYDVGYMPYAPACYAGTYAGCHGGGYGGCFSSCYSSSCFGSCYTGGYGGWAYGHGCYGGGKHRRGLFGGLFGHKRRGCGGCNPCVPVYSGCHGGCYGGCYGGWYGGGYASNYAGPFMGGWVSDLGGMSHIGYEPLFGSYTPSFYSAPVDAGYASAQGQTAQPQTAQPQYGAPNNQYLTQPQNQTAPFTNGSDLAPETAPEMATPPPTEEVPPAEPAPAPAPAPGGELPGGELNVPPPPVNEAPGV